jgi:hypothetical protein
MGIRRFSFFLFQARQEKKEPAVSRMGKRPVLGGFDGRSIVLSDRSAYRCEPCELPLWAIAWLMLELLWLLLEDLL